METDTSEQRLESLLADAVTGKLGVCQALGVLMDEMDPDGQKQGGRDMMGNTTAARVLHIVSDNSTERCAEATP